MAHVQVQFSYATESSTTMAVVAASFGDSGVFFLVMLQDDGVWFWRSCGNAVETMFPNLCTFEWQLKLVS